MNSPRMKAWVEEHISLGSHQFVIDLQDCTGMDSTFMGTMAGIAMRLMRFPDGRLYVTDASEKNAQSLEDLGLGSFIEINPDSAAWIDDKALIRKSLVECSDSVANDRAQHVYEAHKQLVDADEGNTEKFSTVLDCLEAELKKRATR